MFPSSLLSRLVALVGGERRRRYLGLRGRGQEWEDLAEKRLKSEGYRILDRNFRTKVGELDFVARDGPTLCFIEVKGRRSLRFGAPAEAVTLEKQRRIYRAAEAYLQGKRLSESTCRFDVVSIIDAEDGERVQILRDAFRGPLPPRPRR
jgi:putative endonuclease